MSGPIFRVNHLHLKGLRSIREIDLPRQGPGWKGRVPDCVMMGGANGSGKTTLFEFIVAAASYLGVGVGPSWHQEVEAATLDFDVRPAGVWSGIIRYMIGDEAYIKGREASNYFAYAPGKGVSWGNVSPGKIFPAVGKNDADNVASGLPALVYLPSEGRTLVTPSTKLKAAGKLPRPTQFLNVWHPPQKWEESLEAVLYAARWEDLNAREEGRDDETNHFEQFAEAFRFFCGATKTIQWHRGELIVEMKDTGTRHDINALSSGEKQVLLLATELLLRWRPGSLILIDEPELHLHPAWQVRLWQALVKWQNERGGQVFVATQSSELFGVAEPGTTLLLGGDTL